METTDSFDGTKSWRAAATCSCGWKQVEVWPSRESAEQLAVAKYETHLAESRGKAVQGGAGTTIGALLLGLVVVGIPIALVVGLIVKITDGSDGPEPQPPNPRVTNSNFDCEKSVSYLMERQYGSWGSGSWPDGEYDRRVDQCEAVHR